MKNLILSMLVLLLSSSIIKAQSSTPPDKKNSLSLMIGLDNSYFKDINFSPLNYHATGIPITLEYQRSTKSNSIFYSSVHFTNSVMKNDASELFRTARYFADIEIGYLKEVATIHDNISWKAGAAYHTYLDLAFFAGTNSVSFTGIHGLDLATAFSVDLGAKHQLDAHASLPVFGKLIRPPYSGWDKFISEHENNVLPIFFRGKWTSLNDFFGINGNIKYSYHLNEKWDLLAKYQFRYYTTDVTEKVIIATNQISIGTQLKF